MMMMMIIVLLAFEISCSSEYEKNFDNLWTREGSEHYHNSVRTLTDVSLCSSWFLAEHSKDWPACDIVQADQSLPSTQIILFGLSDISSWMIMTLGFSIWISTQDFGTYHIFKHRKLRLSRAIAACWRWILGPKIRPLASLDTSAWAFIWGICYKYRNLVCWPIYAY